jgi:hypothetical protein
LLEIDKTRTMYQPMSDGLVERLNRTLEAMLAMYVSRDQRDWDQYLPYLMMAYRSAIQTSTGYTPYMLMMGRQPRIPSDLWWDGLNDGEARASPSQYVTQLQQTLLDVHACSREHLRIAGDTQKECYDRRSKDIRYKRGDKVWLLCERRYKGLSPKLAKPWTGPYELIGVMGDTIYKIQLNDRSKSQVVHFNRLKPYTQPIDEEIMDNNCEPQTVGVENSREDKKETEERRSSRGRLLRKPSYWGVRADENGPESEQ